jgi:hypothetical protein
VDVKLAVAALEKEGMGSKSDKGASTTFEESSKDNPNTQNIRDVFKEEKKLFIRFFADAYSSISVSQVIFFKI